MLRKFLALVTDYLVA